MSSIFSKIVNGEIPCYKIDEDDKCLAFLDINPNSYPHNTILDRLFDQAKAKAWVKINNPKHPGYHYLVELKNDKDGHTNRTRENREDILNLSFPKDNSIGTFPK